MIKEVKKKKKKKKKTRRVHDAKSSKYSISIIFLTRKLPVGIQKS